MENFEYADVDKIQIDIHKKEESVYVYSLADFTAQQGARDTTDIMEKYRKGALSAKGMKNMIRNVNVIANINGNKIVLINDIIFRGKRSVNWKDVEEYLKQYVDEFFEIADTKDVVYIGPDLPDEYANSKYTHMLKGMSAKAKANAAQGLPEMIKIASGKHFEENRKDKHSRDAKFGWYRYESRFALPVFDESGDVERYNVFHVLMLMRHARDGKMYLYDVMEIKKETSKLFQSNDFTQ